MKVIVIGGGPSGMMASISASKNNKVILLEKNNQLGIKLLMSGNGRCNLTNNKSVDEFINNCSKSTRFMYYSLNKFSIKDLMNFFIERNCELIEEDNNKVFPKSNKASSILHVLENQMKENKVDIKLNHEVYDWIIKDNQILGVKTNMGNIYGDHFILTCGGKSFPKTGSNGFGYKLAKRVGHSLTKLYGTEVALVSNDKVIQDKYLMGLSLSNIKVGLIVDNKLKKQVQGDLIITHFGLSGPIILELSEEVVLNLRKNKKVQIKITTIENIEFYKKRLKDNVKNLGPRRWIDYLVSNQERNMEEISKKELLKINENLTDFRFNILDSLPIEKATVTAGGIKTNEIDSKTMKSLKVSNLSICGEIIDMHGPIGGYNLTLAFISGYIAGESI
ncbi:MAG: NAD(P)/FAD-dependent oxidoreductase [Erysipelotrichaceae bacterium]|nr:NAD(P)/FAD-dependent oxidoreductase [Erysipelotrichaceae bacterium]